jgi:hypothetical protein
MLLTDIITKGYHNTVICDESFRTRKGRVVYRRRNESDLLIVPHNNKILMDWDGHAYLDVCSTETVIFFCINTYIKDLRKTN